jgi:diguanylate cyclase (GGDEF)-like protein
VTESDARGIGVREKCEQLDELYALLLGTPPEGLTRDDEFAQVHEAVAQIRKFVRALAEGDLRGELSVRGPVAGPLKSLSSSLKHMTWQAKEIAGGDLSQRIDFLGEFSTAFNEMAERLDLTLNELRSSERELSDANQSLQEAHAQLLEQATHDPLTGLLNRRSLSERWAAETARADRDSEPIAILLADLDNFKSINDTCGHEGGDTVLVSFARTLSAQLRASDIACRMGGDEFIVLIPGVALDEGAQVANRIRDAFATADLGSGLEDCTHTASFGIAEYPANGTTLEAVTLAADEALYRVKAAGRNRVAGAS